MICKRVGLFRFFFIKETENVASHLASYLAERIVCEVVPVDDICKGGS